MHVPAVMSWPAVIPARQMVHEVCMTMDVLFVAFGKASDVARRPPTMQLCVQTGRAITINNIGRTTQCGYDEEASACIWHVRYRRELHNHFHVRIARAV